MAAYPILLTLPQRFSAPVSTNAPVENPAQAKHAKQETPVQERRRYSTDPKTFHALLALAAESSAPKVSQAITRAIAQTMLSDLCFLMYLTDNKNQMIIASGYDLIREESLEGGSLNKNAIPMLANSIQRGRPLRMPASSTSADIKGLSELLGLQNPGNLLASADCHRRERFDRRHYPAFAILQPFMERGRSGFPRQHRCILGADHPAQSKDEQAGANE